MPPFAECQDRYDDSFFVNNISPFLTKPKQKSNDYDIMTNESIAATDVSVTSKVTSFYEKLMDFNLCCTHDQAEISLPNDNECNNKVQEESKEEISVEQEKVMINNINMDQGANDDDEQIRKEISMDILMKKAEEADRHNKAVAERYESTSENSVSVVVARDDDEVTIPSKNNTQYEEKKLIILKNLEKKTPDQSKSLRENSKAESMTGKKPSLLVHGENFVLDDKNKQNSNKGAKRLSTKKKRWSTKGTKKLLPMKKTEIMAISECGGMLLNDKKKPSMMMKYIKKSLTLPKIKSNQTKNDMSSDEKKKASMVKRIKKSISLTKIKSNRTTKNELSSDESKKKSSMAKRIKKSMSFKKVNSNRSMNSSNLSSSNQKKKKSSMVKRIKKSLSLKKVNSNRSVNSIHVSSSNQTKKKSSMVKSNKKSLSLKKVKSIYQNNSEASLPVNTDRKKTASMMMKNGKKSFSFKKKVNRNKFQIDTVRAGPSSFEKQMNLMG